MGHIVQRLVRNAILQAVNQVIQKKTQQEAAKFGNEWKGSFHCLVSGYYSGMTVKYLMLPFAVFCILCAIGSGIAGGRGQCRHWHRRGNWRRAGGTESANRKFKSYTTARLPACRRRNS